MKLFLLSTTDNLNQNLSQDLKTEIEKRGNKVAYVSSEPQVETKPYYLSTIQDFHMINENIQVDYFDLSENFSDTKLLTLLDYKTIYLSGGNTYIFIDSANKRNLVSILNTHIASGGLLIGASAGSIMMTPSIDLAGYADENVLHLSDTDAFGFVDFQFHPHFTNTEEERKYLSDYKKEKGAVIYVCKDGEGLSFEDGSIALFGSTTEFIG